MRKYIQALQTAIHTTRADHLMPASPLGGPIAICTLAGDARHWDETTPHEFKPIGFADPIAGPTAAPARLSAHITAAFDGLFVGSKCRKCGSCDPRTTGHWYHKGAI